MPSPFPSCLAVIVHETLQPIHVKVAHENWATKGPATPCAVHSKIAFLSMTHAYIQTLGEIWCRISCLTLRHSAIISFIRCHGYSLSDFPQPLFKSGDYSRVAFIKPDSSTKQCIKGMFNPFLGYLRWPFVLQYDCKATTRYVASFFSGRIPKV